MKTLSLDPCVPAYKAAGFGSVSRVRAQARTPGVPRANCEKAKREPTAETDRHRQDTALDALPEGKRWEPVPGTTGWQVRESPNETAPTMQSTVAALLASGKGILAADESIPTIEKRFAALRIPATEENRRAYREALFTTPGLRQFISGAILFDETLHQKGGAGISLSETLVRQGIIPGIKVDQGTVALANFPGEKITQGLDGLRERLARYRRLGARFTKWRAVITIGDRMPTAAGIEANAGPLAQFAALSGMIRTSVTLCLGT